MRIHRKTVSIIALGLMGSAACAGQSDLEDLEDELGAAHQPLQNANNVTQAQNGSAPYSAVIKISTDAVDGSLDSRGIGECSGLKFRSGTSSNNPDRFLTAAHCLEGYEGGQATIRITNNVTLQDRGLVHRVSKIYLHPTWRLWRGNSEPDFYGDQFDIAILDAHPITGSNNIPANGSVHPEWIPTPGLAARVVAYGSGSKRWGDNETAPINGQSGLWDESVAIVPYMFWYGNPASEGGDSGAPLLSTLPPDGSWQIIGVLADRAPGSTPSTAFSRTSSVRRWLQAPESQPSPQASAQGRLINARYVKCLTMFSTTNGSFATAYSCLGDPDGTTHNQYWNLVASGSFLQIRSGKSGRCLQPNSANPAEIIQSTCSSSSTAQRWEFLVDNNDVPGQGTVVDSLPVYRIRNTQTNTCLYPLAGQNARLRLQTCSDATLNQQKWAFSR